MSNMLRSLRFHFHAFLFHFWILSFAPSISIDNFKYCNSTIIFALIIPSAFIVLDYPHLYNSLLLKYKALCCPCTLLWPTTSELKTPFTIVHEMHLIRTYAQCRIQLRTLRGCPCSPCQGMYIPRVHTETHGCDWCVRKVWCVGWVQGTWENLF